MPYKTKTEIDGRINACQQELQQYDYAARKVVFELAAKLKELHPNVDFPIYEKYKDIEANAEERRAEIRELEKARETAEDERIWRGRFIDRQ